MNGHDQDPVTQTVEELRQLSERIFDARPDDEIVDEDAPVEWADPDTQRSYRLLSGFMGDVVVLETDASGSWEDGTTYRAGFSGLTIGTNERPVPGVSFQDRFSSVIKAMRTKLEGQS